MIEKIRTDFGSRQLSCFVFQFDRQDCPPGLINYWVFPSLVFGTRMPRYTIVRHVVGKRGARSYVPEQV